MAENKDNIFEFTGKTVDEAVAEGLARLNLVRSDVAVEVLSKGSRGIFGIGSEPARVRIIIERDSASGEAADQSVDAQGTTQEPAPAPAAEGEEERLEEARAPSDVAVDRPVAKADEYTAGSEAEAEQSSAKDADVESQGESSRSTEITDDELAGIASEMLGEIVRLMGFEADVVASWQVQDDNGGSQVLLLDIEGEDLGALIGRRGETLASLQYIVRLMVNQRIKEWRNIVVDVEKYKERREAQLTQLALRMAEQVVDTGRAMALEPMPPNERRLVHIALRDHPDVYTQSSGEDERRKVNIVPKDTA